MIPSGEEIVVDDKADENPEEILPDATEAPSAEEPTGPITGKTNTNAVNLRSKTSTESDAVARVQELLDRRYQG